MGNPAFRTGLQRILFEEGRRQSWLAQRAGIHPSTLSQIVTGRLMATEDQALRIADALEREVADLGLTVLRRAA